MATNQVTKLFRKEARFIAGAAEPRQIPKFFLPEIAFIGKSNVGKSSLINAICNRKELARVSHTPGRTQKINFFALEDKAIFVDLPGYGFAKVPPTMKRQWERLITYYLENRENLKLVNVLIDSRRGIKAHDMEVIKLLSSYQRDFQIIFTKADKIGDRKELLTECENFLASFNYSCNVMFVSSRSGEGLKEMQFFLSKYAKS